MKRYTYIKEEGGMTLIEVLIATGVVSVALLSLYLTMLSCMKLSEVDGEIKSALMDLETVVEDISSTPYRDLKTRFPEETPLTTYNNLPEEELTVSYNDIEDGLTEITITVTWKSCLGRTLSKSVVTMKGE